MDININVLEIQQKINKIKKQDQQVNLVAATKYASVEQMIALYHSGIKKMGESRVEVLLQKQKRFNLPVEWHFIGTLQSRKVKGMINEIDALHSLDRLSLAKEIEKFRSKPLKCFVQVNTSGEETKKGLRPSEVMSFIHELKPYAKIEVIGLMTMAPNTKDTQIIRTCFQTLKSLQQEIQQKMTWATCENLSMGMSNDYLVAIEEGATHIRLGSILLKHNE